jgi:hypothetical protein
MRVPLVASNDALMELRNKLANRANTVTNLGKLGIKKGNETKRMVNAKIIFVEEAKEVRKPEPKPAPQPVTQPTPSTSTPTPTPTPTQPPPATTKPSANFARALYEYAAVEEGELSFQEGARIEVLMRDDSGWWQGQCGDTIGWFPAEYVSEIKEPSPTPSPTPIVTAPTPAPPPTLTVTPTPPAPAAAHTPATGEDGADEDDEIREDDIIDLSNVGSSQDRLVSSVNFHNNFIFYILYFIFYILYFIFYIY